MGKVLKFERSEDHDFLSALSIRIENLGNMVGFVEQASGGDLQTVSMTQAQIEGMMGTVRRELDAILGELIDTL